jgi:hypothetical protein
MLSQLPLTVEIPLDALATLVNEYVAEYLHTHHNWLESKEVRQIRIRLRSEVRMVAREEKLITDVPLEIEADVLPTLLKGLAGFALFDKLQRINFAISLRFQTEIAIAAEGQLQTQTEVDFAWDRKPTAATGLVSLRAFFNPLIERELETLSESIDQDLSLAINLPELLQGAWQQLGQWEKVLEDPPVWFLFAMDKISSDRKMQIRSRTLQLPMLLEGKLALCLSMQKPQAPAIPPFQYSRADTLRDTGAQKLDFQMSFAELNQYLQQTPFDLSLDGMPFFMEKVNLEVQGENWIMRGELKGKWSGIPFRGGGQIVAQLTKADYPLALKIQDMEIRHGNLPFRLGLRFLGKKRLNALLTQEINLLLEDIREQVEQSWALVELPDSLWLKGEKRQGKVLGIRDMGLSLSLKMGFEARARIILRR